jgi:hypothetical protein
MSAEAASPAWSWVTRAPKSRGGGEQQLWCSLARILRAGRRVQTTTFTDETRAVDPTSAKNSIAGTLGSWDRRPMPMTNFDPVKHGLHFSNNNITWSFAGISGKAMCGGMAYASLDFYYNGLAVPMVGAPPAENTPLHGYLYHRQINAHGFAAPELVSKSFFTNSTGGQFSWGMKLADDFGRVKRWIDAGKPVPVVLMARDNPVSDASHWVVVIGYETAYNGNYGGECCAKLYLYDNNYPDEVCELHPNVGAEIYDHSRDAKKFRTYFPDNNFQTQVPPAEIRDMGVQHEWDFCKVCSGLFYSQSGGVRCGGGGTHQGWGSNYRLPGETLKFCQPDWRYCHKCSGLFYSKSGGRTCPAGGSHDDRLSKPYSVYLGREGYQGQSGWRYCSRCSGMIHTSGGQRCPAGYTHDFSLSGQYFV